jgi:exodeoxyribonuclease VII small subunit
MSKNVPQTETIGQKIEAFERLVAWFDTDDFSLQEALGKFEEAEKLAREIESELASVKNRVEVLKKKFDQPDA